MEGSGPIDNDNKFNGELYVSQKERAFLENLQVSRQPGPESKTLTLPEIEEKLENIIKVNGEEELNKVRDRARAISEELGMQAEYEKLNKMIGALLITKPSKILSSPVAIARAYGNPFDKHRIELFEKLFRRSSKVSSPTGLTKIQRRPNSGILYSLRLIFPTILSATVLPIFRGCEVR